MNASQIFRKTTKGLSEITSKTDALTLKERRVLILVNGENNAARLKQLSLCENVAEILSTLLDQGFIEQEADISSDTAADESTNTEFDVSAREFMCNTLLTFANRVRVAKLIDEINATENIDKLKDMVKPWYQAIAETPGGMYQADDLRKEVLKMIEDENFGGSS